MWLKNDPLSTQLSSHKLFAFAIASPAGKKIAAVLLPGCAGKGLESQDVCMDDFRRLKSAAGILWC